MPLREAENASLGFFALRDDASGMHTMDRSELISPEVKDEDLSKPRFRVALLLSKLREDLRAGPDLPDEHRQLYEQQINSFSHHLEKIIAIDDEELRKTALEAIQSATYIGAYRAASHRILQKIFQKIEKARTKKANAAVRKDEIQEIIKRHMEELNKRSPTRKFKVKEIAEEIYIAVVNDVNNLENVPEAWKLDNKELQKGVVNERILENIRGYIRRM